MASLRPIRYENRTLSIIDQLQLPQVLVYVDIKTVQDGWDAIKYMKTRGITLQSLIKQTFTF